MDKNMKHTQDSTKKPRKLKILYVINDLYSFSENGLLSDIALELPLELHRSGYEIQIFQPFFGEITTSKLPYQNLSIDFQINLADRMLGGGIFKVTHSSTIDFICVKNDDLYGMRRNCLEKRGDDVENLNRLSFFCHSVFSYLNRMESKPDIIHCVGWETGLVPAILKKIFSTNPHLNEIKTIFSVNNFFSQGNFDAGNFPNTGLPWSCYNLHEMEFWGKFSFIKGGIVYSDGLVVMGENSIDNFLQPGKSFGLHGVIAKRKDSAWAVPAGIDAGKWDPSVDPMIPFKYSSDDFSKKRENKNTLLKELGLPGNMDFPLVGIIGDLAYYNRQGDNLERTLEILCQLESSYIIFGKNNRQTVENLKVFNGKCAGKYTLVDDESLKTLHRLLSGIDILLMPSSYKTLPFLPLYALRYGVLPVVSRVFGGTSGISQFSRKTRNGSAFCFDDSTLISMLGKIISAINAIRFEGEQPNIISNCMADQHSWENALAKINKIYKNTLS